MKFIEYGTKTYQYPPTGGYESKPIPEYFIKVRFPWTCKHYEIKTDTEYLAYSGRSLFWHYPDPWHRWICIRYGLSCTPIRELTPQEARCL